MSYHRCARPNCRNLARVGAYCHTHVPEPAGSKRRTVRLTDKGRAAIGAPVLVDVPLLDLPWFEDRKRGAA